jgi:hypothetical protein
MTGYSELDTFQRTLFEDTPLGSLAGGDLNGLLGAAAPAVCEVYAATLSFLALRASRYFLIFDLATSLCFEQTIPKTGAAGFLQPGTGQS